MSLLLRASRPHKAEGCAGRIDTSKFFIKGGKVLTILYECMPNMRATPRAPRTQAVRHAAQNRTSTCYATRWDDVAGVEYTAPAIDSLAPDFNVELSLSSSHARQYCVTDPPFPDARRVGAIYDCTLSSRSGASMFCRRARTPSFVQQILAFVMFGLLQPNRHVLEAKPVKVVAIDQLRIRSGGERRPQDFDAMHHSKVRPLGISSLEHSVSIFRASSRVRISYVPKFIIEELVKKHSSDCRAFLDAALEVGRTPYTQNTHYLQSCEEKWLAKYKDSRANAAGISPSPSQQHIAAALQYLTAAGYSGLKAEDLGKLHPADEYENEMRIMAEVRSFFQVSYKRITDYVPMLIDLKVMTDIHAFLISEMKLVGQGAEERCAKYLAEDPEVVARREEIMARRTTLENVQKELNNFERSI
ncbi:hypothetical protein EVG20_g9535 [Dentipellis fragilis]|uniref:GED domain-containing protein n=1 Tax=Dentipellis fragilis TaxID=205917 RepID=A0A4Y9Y0F6_9AGAM|nr:hypothetical protein EVG20_g9535 [Dentipellis fragilis]